MNELRIGIIALDKFRIDDPVGAFPVHGLCGIWGGLATGIFGNVPEAFASRVDYLVVQTIGSAAIPAAAFGGMFVLFFILKGMGILRVSPEEEERGLDITEHGMHAYTS